MQIFNNKMVAMMLLDHGANVDHLKKCEQHDINYPACIYHCLLSNSVM